MTWKDNHPIEYAILCETLGEPWAWIGHVPGWGPQRTIPHHWCEFAIVPGSNGKWCIGHYKMNFKDNLSFEQLLASAKEYASHFARTKAS